MASAAASTLSPSEDDIRHLEQTMYSQGTSLSNRTAAAVGGFEKGTAVVVVVAYSSR